MTTRLGLLLFCVLNGVLIPACISPVEFSGPEPQRTLVVSGLITNNPELRFVQLNWLQAANTDGELASEPITSAQVNLLAGEEELGEFELANGGIYVYTQEFVPDPSQEYGIQVLLDGNEYRSRPTAFPLSYKPDSVTFDYTERVLEVVQPYNIPIRKMFIDVHVHNTLPPGNSDRFFRWEVDESWSLFELPQPNPFIPQETCYFFRDRRNNPVSIQSTASLNPGPFSKFLLTKQLNLEFKDRHFFNVYQYSVSREAFEYYEKVEQLGSDVGNVFDEIPAIVTGNVANSNDQTETVLGYVEFSQVDTFRQDIFELLIPVTFFQDCGTFNPQPFCFECETVRGASLDRPYYWD